MEDRRKKNIEIFLDTEQLYRSHRRLARAVRVSLKKQVFVLGTAPVRVPAPRKKVAAMVTVSGKRTLEAAEVYAKQGKRVCVLNFASATNPGGGVMGGSSAQEESICRCSTLYPCLNAGAMWRAFYMPHRDAGDPLYNDDCIYTPDVCVFKSDVSFPERLPERAWWRVNVITCAAPNLREDPSNGMNPCAGNAPAKVTQEELEMLLTNRVRRIFEVAASKKCEVLILGAFGCGAFRNPPAVVAKVFHTVMQDYLHHFDAIEYAVFHTEKETLNYETFLREI